MRVMSKIVIADLGPPVCSSHSLPRGCVQRSVAADSHPAPGRLRAKQLKFESRSCFGEQTYSFAHDNWEREQRELVNEFICEEPAQQCATAL